MYNFSIHRARARRDEATNQEVEDRKMNENSNRSRFFPILLVTIVALIMILPTGIASVKATGCFTDNEYWTPATGITYSQAAQACLKSWTVSSSANSPTLVPQSGTYKIQACHVPSNQQAICDSTNDVYSKTFTTGLGVFPNQSIRYNNTNANTYTVELNVKVLYTTTGATNTINSYACATTLPTCPV